MKVVICGAGQVGFGIAEQLAAEKNDVSVIDKSPQLIQSISDKLEVRGFVGNGAHPDVLSRAGGADADMLIAVTLHDEVNMVACQVAHSLFNVPTKIARIRAQSYREPHWSDLFSREHMPIDVIISPEVEVGETVLRRLALPGAVETVAMADGAIIVAGLLCDENCPVVDTPLRQLTELFPDLKAVIIGVKRGERLFAPRSSDALLVGDIAYVATERGQVSRTLGIFGKEEVPANRVIIAGGGNIGIYVARAIEERLPHATLKLIEADRARAVSIADDLKRGIVLHGSALDEGILEEAGIGESETLVAITNDEKANVLACVMARSLGCARGLALVNSPSYVTLAETLGIDAHVNPKAVTVSKILQHVRRGRIRSVHALESGKGEIIEAEALETSPLVGKPLRDVTLLGGMRIGAIFRKDKVILPRGETVIQARDRVILFAERESVRRVEQLFRVSLEFF
ncbi:Trk system potassium transport protein TrkA [Agaricicola taiwanensis]|uniref:Trk system potassium uptake protein TrkA n=1 Tax=Agaricicola taiwanensis TaxID=591372 RepID=A0A8J2YIK2_9RHOB|nr:Trk system potassium transporter TrkA [Agaricicola taiwanensis]GGE45466.1 Trk system potassium transport protein TrkA [Agaricicola taiwanensis]